MSLVGTLIAMNTVNIGTTQTGLMNMASAENTQTAASPRFEGLM